MSNDEINKIDLKTDLLKYCQTFNKIIKIKDVDLELNLKVYNNINIIDEIYKWQSCLGMMGKDIFKSKDIIKILYCLITDSCILENIPGIDLYNSILNRFYQINYINKESRQIKLRVFPICNTLIIIDFKKYPEYKIYELYNIDKVKEYYMANKINFDTIIKDIKLDPIFLGDVMNLKENYKVISSNKFNKENHISQLEKFLSNYKKLERDIIKEYKKIRLFK